ncbi:BclB C-terminal domain-containing protein [Paenibacillaceae bacterium GAS479]|nr:BclB C-terminal domain-containing protein [Paenibacillaceae bacterium GAS479]
MNEEFDQKAKLHSYKPHTEDHCRPCPKPPKKNCLIIFTPDQADLFQDLLDGLIASIQISFIPPMGPLPSVLRVLQNLFKEMRLSLREQAALFAATELNITAYEQSDRWSDALIAATSQTLTELYAFSLLACVSSDVKDGWVIRIRMAETNLAGVSGAVPPAISGTVLTFDGGNVETSLSLSTTTGLPINGAIPIINFTSGSIPVTTTNAGQVVSIELANNVGGNNFAFSMPRQGTLTTLSVSFFPENTTISGGSITVQVQLCRALPGSPLYTPLVAIPGTVASLVPALSGSTKFIGCAVSLDNLNIALSPEDRLALVFTISSSNPKVTPSTLSGTLAGFITIEPVNAPPTSAGPIIPIASNHAVNLEFGSNGNALSAGIIGYGFSENQDFVSFGAPISVSSQLVNFTSPLNANGTITEFAAYFSINVTNTSALAQPITVDAEIYKYSPATNQVSPLPDTFLHVGDFLETTITQTTPPVHSVKTGLNIAVSSGDRFVLVFTVLSAGPVPSGLVSGWASGGISIGLSSS